MIIVRRVGIAGFLALALAAPPAVGATVQVTFKDPGQFTDVGDTARLVPDARRDAILDQLRSHIRRRAARQLVGKSQLTVTVTDIDMAGNFETTRGPNLDHVRVYRDVYPPRIKLEFVLTDGAGGILKEGKRDLTDTAYLKTNIETCDDLLRHEKKLIDDWIAREFAATP